MRKKIFLIFFITLLISLAYLTTCLNIACLINKEENQNNLIVNLFEKEINDAVTETKKPQINKISENQNNKKNINNTYENNLDPVFKPGDRLIFALQSAGFSELKKSDFNIAVIDCDDSRLLDTEIRKLKEQGKSIISYLSVGEAENYRIYWQKDWKPGSPDFIEAENPAWPGNYKVRFWYQQWQEIIFSKIDEIVHLGYDGVYLDVIDAYEYFEDKGSNVLDYVNPKIEMVEFVKAISLRAKTINPQFLIIPQNAEELLHEKGYIEAIDGLGRESLWFEKNKRIENVIMSEILNNLIYAKYNGKFIFAISYVNDKNLAGEFLQLCSIYGFISYIGPLELNLIE